MLIVTSSGITALHLPGGWTAHSMFRLLLDDGNFAGCVCNIPAESPCADLLRNCNLIVWDELLTAHRFSIEAVNLTLQDIMNKRPLGGTYLLFSGGMRQTGPTVKFETEDDTLEAFIIPSPLRKHFPPNLSRYFST